MGRNGYRRAPTLALFVVVALSVGLACSREPEGTKAKEGSPGSSPGASATSGATPPPQVTFNQQFIEGLYSRLPLDSEEAVFKAVFQALGSEALVYPTENHYYFTLHASGKTIWGNLRLDASDRDQGIIHLGYFEFDENGRSPLGEGRGKAFSSKDGVLVRRLEPLVYSVSHAGKTVIFRLHDSGRERPKGALLRARERFVGPIFDESGLKFFLLFNVAEKHFMYVLNEERDVPEAFLPASEDVVIGKRTGLSFFQDNKNSRKILIGVHSSSAHRNNWYDGPADQLPDNYAEDTKIATYIQEAYPATKGTIDTFGGYTNKKGYRVLIVPYTVYSHEEELTRLVESCKRLELTEDRFYTCLTPDPYQ